MSYPDWRDNPEINLDYQKAREIRRLHKQGYSQKQLAWLFEVSKTTIRRVVRNQSWRERDPVKGPISPEVRRLQTLGDAPQQRSYPPANQLSLPLSTLRSNTVEGDEQREEPNQSKGNSPRSPLKRKTY